MKYYTEDHIWVEIRGEEATVGISSHAAEEMGDIDYIELPLEDEDVIVGDEIGLVESNVDSMEIYAPISGTIVAVNDELESEPALISDSPEEKGWICKMTNIDDSELDDMMDSTFYRKYLRSLKR
ncbi:MAG: glycine cleavage system protein GcvH [Lentisphaerae bacterium]|nr:glycine cleavage system protein GcvH [Lentisphaerota bacterium]